MERARLLQPNLVRLGMKTDNKKGVLGGHPPKKGQPPVTSSRLPMASFPLGPIRLGARPWQRENYDRSHCWQDKLAERATLFAFR